MHDLCPSTFVLRHYVLYLHFIALCLLTCSYSFVTRSCLFVCLLAAICLFTHSCLQILQPMWCMVGHIIIQHFPPSLPTTSVSSPIANQFPMAVCNAVYNLDTVIQSTIRPYAQCGIIRITAFLNRLVPL